MPGGPTIPALSNSEGTAASFFAVVANGLRRPMRVTLLLTLMFAFAAVRAFAQGKNPYAGDAKIAKLGEYQFRLNCAFCHGLGARGGGRGPDLTRDRKSTRLNSSHRCISYAVFCLKKKKKMTDQQRPHTTRL